MNYIDGLTGAQARAVITDHAQILVSAGAGSGKTATVTRRIQRLMGDGWMGSSILAITFTNKAADEMRHRLLAAGVRRRQLPDVSTFHGFAVRVIRSLPHLVQRTEQLRILDEIDAEDMLRRAARDARVKAWQTAPLNKLRADENVMAAYEDALRAADAVDFDHIESGCWTVLQHEDGVAMWRGRYAHIIVDEYQDTNPVQSKIADALRPEQLFVVGDDRQSIYGFRGSDPAFIRHAMTSPDWRHIELADNFRSRPEIVDLANRICAESSPMVARRPGPAMVTTTVSDDLACVARLLGAHRDSGVLPRDMAVLARTWAHLVDVEAELRAAGIPCLVYAEKDDPWRTVAGRAIAATLQLVCSPFADELALRVYTLAAMERNARFPLEPPAAETRDVRAQAAVERLGVLHYLAAQSPSTTPGGDLWSSILAAAPEHSAMPLVRHLVSHITFLREELDDVLASPLLAADTDDRTIGDFIDRWAFRSTADRVKPDGDAVHLMTVHAAKGLEWPVVALVEVCDGVYPSRRASSTEETYEEDRRVLYVAATRARDALHIMRRRTVRYYDGSIREVQPSPFLAFLEGA